MAFIAQQSYKIDLTPQGGYVVVYVSQHDNGARGIVFKIYNQGKVFDIPANINISVQGVKPNGGYFTHNCTYSGNLVTMPIADDMTDVIGKAVCVLKFTNASEEKLATAKFILNVDSDSSSEGIIIDTVAEEIFDQLIDEIRAQAAVINVNIATLQSMVGTPLIATTAAGMTDHNKIYVYTGGETGYTYGDWYYWNDSEWQSGGQYNSVPIIIDQIPISGSTNPVSSNGVYNTLGNKVDKVSGKGLSTEDYTTAEKEKLEGLEQIDVDDTLSIKGAAADSKTVGDKFIGLKSTVVDKTAMVNCQIVSIQASENRCDMSAIVQKKSINWSTGAVNDNNNKCLYYIDITPGDILYIWELNSSSNIISYNAESFTTYDQSGDFVRKGTNVAAHNYTVPEGVYRVCMQLNQIHLDSGYKFIIIVNNDEQPIGYEPYSDAHDEYVAKNEFLVNASIVGKKKIPINAFPKNLYINYNGIITNNANFLATDYIRVYDNDVIDAAGYSYVDANSNLRTNVVSFFGEDFSFISGICSSESSGLIMVENVSVPSGAKYVVFGKHITLSASKSYSYITRQYANIEKTDGEDVSFRILPVLPVKKIISILGDSITQGEVATDRPNASYAGILRQFFGLEYGNHMNYGFVSMSRSKDMVYLTSWTGWNETVGSTTAIGGDEYSTTTAGSKLVFRIGKQFNKVRIATKYGSGYGTLILAQGESVFGSIDCSVGDGASFSDEIDISSADFTQPFTIMASGNASVSGLVLIDDEDSWSFMNYGRSGAAASVFTGDTFDIQTDADIVIYALGVNGTEEQLLDSLNAIKERFLNLDAHKIVLDLNFTTAQRNGAKKHSLLKQFANETKAKYICVWDYVPKDDTNGYVAGGFLNTDGIHPIDAGHQFIAELIAKEIGLSVTSREFAQDVLNTKITWTVN